MSNHPLIQLAEDRSPRERESSQVVAEEVSKKTKALLSNQLNLRCKRARGGSGTKKPLATKRRHKDNKGGDGNNQPQVQFPMEQQQHSYDKHLTSDMVSFSTRADTWLKGNPISPQWRQHVSYCKSSVWHEFQNVKQSEPNSNRSKTNKKKDMSMVDLAAILEKCQRFHGLWGVCFAVISVIVRTHQILINCRLESSSTKAYPTIIHSMGKCFSQDFSIINQK